MVAICLWNVPEHIPACAVRLLLHKKNKTQGHQTSSKQQIISYPWVPQNRSSTKLCNTHDLLVGQPVPENLTTLPSTGFFLKSCFRCRTVRSQATLKYTLQYCTTFSTLSVIQNIKLGKNRQWKTYLSTTGLHHFSVFITSQKAVRGSIKQKTANY